MTATTAEARASGANGADAARATLMVALGACGFGAISIFVALATRAGAPLVAVLTWRYVLAASVLTIALFATGRRPDRRGFRVMMTVGLVQALIAVLSLSALRYVSAATLAFLFYTYPAFVAVLARIRHSEPLTPLRLGALALSLGGIFVMIGAPGSESLHPVGVALALVSALMYALYIPTVGSMTRELTPLATTMYMTAGAAVFLGVAGLARNELGVGLTLEAWESIVALGLVSTAGAFLVFLRGLAVLGPVRTAIVSTIEPFFTALLGVWFLAQPLTRGTLMGGALIAVAVALLQLRSRRQA